MCHSGYGMDGQRPRIVRGEDGQTSSRRGSSLAKAEATCMSDHKPKGIRREWGSEQAHRGSTRTCFSSGRLCSQLPLEEAWLYSGNVTGFLLSCAAGSITPALDLFGFPYSHPSACKGNLSLPVVLAAKIQAAPFSRYCSDTEKARF